MFLGWKQPAEGGRVSAYLSACEPAQAGKIQRRNRTDGAWQDVATAILSACEPAYRTSGAGRHAQAGSTLVDQPLKTQLEYRVIAINKSGEGSPSNTVMVVL